MPNGVKATVIGTASAGPAQQLQVRAVEASADLIEFDGMDLAAGAEAQILRTVLAFKQVPVIIGHNVLSLKVSPSADVVGSALDGQVKSRIDALRWALDATGLLGVREYEVTKADPPDTGAGTISVTPP